MFTVYHKDKNGIFLATSDITAMVPGRTAWLDLINPTDEEKKQIEAHLGVELLTREEIWKNQVLNRFYLEDGASYMTAAIITKVDTPYPQTSAVTFILAENFLLTLRYISPTSFNNFAQRVMRHPQKFTTGSDILEGLLEEVITRVAYNSEVVVNELDQLSHDIFGVDAIEASKKNPSQLMKEIIRRLGASADLNSKINESVHSLNRLLCFFKQVPGNSAEVNAGIQTLITDVMALSHQTGFLSDKITFQLDATLGMINVEQNMIVKIFSIVAVFFLPATLISSIYGMNFEHMPELHWSLGYPMAITIMISCAVVPFIFFRKKGWL